MIYTVTLNPCIDWYAATEALQPGEIHRCGEEIYAPGGKGINVSLLLSRLGAETRALGFAAGFTGREIVRMLEEAGCPADFVFLEKGFSRINLNLTSPQQGETAFNGGGPDVPESAVQALEDKLRALQPGDRLVLAGSIPASLPADTYARLLRAVPEGVQTVVDTAGAALRAAIAEAPWLIKPNVQELGALFGAEITGMEGAKECAFALQEEGARNIAVSMGARGALLLTEAGQFLFCHAPAGEPVSTVGAGDSLVAGMLYGLGLHGTLEGALKWGVAAGSATAFSRGIARREQVFETYRQLGNVHQV